MVGKWLVYVPDPEGGEVQLTLPEHMKAEAHKIAAADDMMKAIEDLFQEETMDVCIGYDHGGNYIYGDAIRTDSDAFRKIRMAYANAIGKEI
jgi:hypothetical protein